MKEENKVDAKVSNRKSIAKGPKKTNRGEIVGVAG